MILKRAAGGRGRRPTLLISRASVERELARSATRSDADSLVGDLEVFIRQAEVSRTDYESRIEALEEENARLRAELAKARDVARLGLIAEEQWSEAAATRREQLRQYLQPDFPDA